MVQSMNLTYKIFNFYKQYISPLNPSSCRFYPTCSEYSLIFFTFSTPFYASVKTIGRILRCNQLFKGGFDHPIVKYTPKYIIKGKKINIKFWLVPIKNNRYYIIRGINE